MKSEAANPKLRIAENVTIGMMGFVLLFILIVDGPIAVLCSAIAMVVPLALLRRFIRAYVRSDFPLISGAFAFTAVATGYILCFYIVRELEAPGVWAAVENGTAPPPAQAGVAGVLIPISALFVGGAAYVVVALVTLAFEGLFTRRR